MPLFQSFQSQKTGQSGRGLLTTLGIATAWPAEDNPLILTKLTEWLIRKRARPCGAHGNARVTNVFHATFPLDYAPMLRGVADIRIRDAT